MRAITANATPQTPPLRAARPGVGGTPRATGGIHAVRIALRIFVLLALTVGAAGFAVVDLEERYLVTTPPLVHGIDVRGLFLDETPVLLTTTAVWEKVPLIATRDAVRSDVTLWRRMNLEDWDTVPVALQHEALEAMLARYGHLLASPDVWDRMGPLDWDLIPQPIRALAFRHMAEYWSGYYQVGAAYDIPRGTIADTLAALVMTESWFEHRAVNVGRWGNRDLGVAQASDRTRRRMVALYHQGAVDVLFEDRDYVDPWKGTRFVALWVALLLDEVDGDVDMAIRAYHRGSREARRGEGVEYLEIARSRLSRFIRNQGGAGSAWDYLWHRDRTLTARSRPWLATAPPTAGEPDGSGNV